MSGTYIASPRSQRQTAGNSHRASGSNTISTATDWVATTTTSHPPLMLRAKPGFVGEVMTAAKNP